VILFISLRLSVASSSDYPPDKNMIPLIAPGIVLERVLTVYHAISAAPFLSAQVAPYVTMFGLRKHPSRNTLCSCSDLTQADNTLSVACAQTSME
jgi:hypothetical protein